MALTFSPTKYTKHQKLTFDDAIDVTYNQLLQKLIDEYNKEKAPQKRIEIIKNFSESYMMSWECWAK